MVKVLRAVLCAMCLMATVALGDPDENDAIEGRSAHLNPWELCASGDKQVQSSAVSYALGLHMLPRTTLIYSSWKHSNDLDVVVEHAKTRKNAVGCP